ncbi:MAG: response regulator [Chloroflexi bacterium]|nr:response regulator [Chloroflexota bacterium]
MEQSPGDRRPDRPWRVSIVDGDPDVRAALSLLLERHPTFAVVAVAEDLEALSGRAERPDAILLDWDLREVRSDDCVRRLRQLHAGAVVIALSTRVEQRAAALAAGAAAFVCKNEAPAQLLAALFGQAGPQPGGKAESISTQPSIWHSP